jgi:hypothetical protein
MKPAPSDDAHPGACGLGNHPGQQRDPDAGQAPDPESGPGTDPAPDPVPDPAPTAINGGLPLSGVLLALAAQTHRQRLSIGDLLAALGDRALGALLFIFAFPNVLPVPPGTSTLLGAPLIFLAAQLMLGRSPWLPAVVSRRSLLHADFVVLVRRVVPWLQRAERLLRPRLSWAALPPMEYALGAVCLLLALVLVLPIPLGNMLPALAISLLALAVLERDGLWALAGLAVAGLSAVVVGGVVFALIKAGLFLLREAFA